MDLLGGLRLPRGLIVAGVVISVLAVPGPAAADPGSGVTRVAGDRQQAPSEAPTEAAAILAAAKYGKPVEVAGQRSELTQVFAQPDGTLRLKTSARPQRVRQGDRWVEANPELRLGNGSVTPIASTLNVKFSDGGPGPMVTVVSPAGKGFSLTWPRELPPPDLDGATATYRDVYPDVDLKLTAGVDSFSQVLVVNTAKAAENSELARLSFDLSTTGVTMQQDPATGFLTAVDGAGAVVFASDGARMWDSPGTTSQQRARGATVSPAVGPEPAPARAETVPVELTPDSLTVVPVADMLTSPDTNFPLYIDPGFNGGRELWTPVSRKNPDRSYWTDSNYRDTMRVGQTYGSTADDDWRTITQWDINLLRGTTIISAALHVNVWHSASCTATPLQLWSTNWIPPTAAVTWNNTKDKTWNYLDQRNGTANKSACPKGNDELKFSAAAIKNTFQGNAKANIGTITLAFRAQSESDEDQWKKLVAGSAYLDISYNRTPGAATGLGFKPCYLACTSPAITSSKRPALTMQAADPDGGTLKYVYEVWNSTRATKVVDSGTAMTGIASNASRTWTINRDLADGKYFWRGRGCDTYVCGGYSSWFEFTVDATNPVLPLIDSDIYKATGWNGAPGTPGTFSFRPGSSASNVTRYTYALNAEKAVTITANADGTATRTLTPTKDFDNALSVESFDVAGNRSGVTIYRFRVKPVGDSWWWGLDEGQGSAAASQPINNRPMTMSTGVAWAGSGRQGTGAATFDGTGEMTTSAPVVDTTTTSGFTVAAFVRLPAPPPAEDDGSGEFEPVLPPAQNQTAVAASGTATSVFRLGYRSDLNVDGDQADTKDPAWCFTLKATDAAAAAETAVCTTLAVTPGAWVHLAGVVDRANNKIQLYVNGSPLRDGILSEAGGTAQWQANGPVVLGRAGTAAAPTERWIGDIDDVHLTPRVWTPLEIDSHANPPEDTELPQ